MDRRLRALRLLHPFPSFLNAALVLGLAVVAGATATVSALLAIGMLALQFAIGITNDLADADTDGVSKPWKPIPSGLVPRSVARAVAVGATAVSVACALLVGPVIALLVIGMLSCGLAYNFWLKPTPFAWACFSVAFVLLPIYAWYGAARVLPPKSEFLLSLAAVAGPALQFANSLADLEADRSAGVRTLVARLGRRRAIVVDAALMVVVNALALVTLTNVSGGVSIGVVVASGLATAGVVLSAMRPVPMRQLGWSLQAVSIAALGLAWVAAVRQA